MAELACPKRQEFSFCCLTDNMRSQGGERRTPYIFRVDWRDRLGHLVCRLLLDTNRAGTAVHSDVASDRHEPAVGPMLAPILAAAVYPDLVFWMRGLCDWKATLEM